MLAASVAYLTLLAGTAAADTLDPNEILARAVVAIDEGREAEALALLEPLSATEQGGEARFAAARASLRLGEPTRALALLNGLEAHLPEIADHVVGLRAQAYRHAGFRVEALQVWQHLLREFPTSPLQAEATLGVADGCFALDRLPEARAAYASALRRLPQSSAAAIARFNVAVIDERAGRFAHAAEGFTHLGYLRNADSVSDLARDRLQALVAAGRASPPPHRTLLARVDRLLAGRHLEQALPAIDELRRAAQTTEQEEATAFRAAQLAYYARDFVTAIAALERLAAAPGARQRTYQSWLAKTLSAAGDFDRAIAAYRDIADRHPRQREGRDALFKAAWLCANGGDHGRALTLFTEYLSRYRRDRHADEALWYSTWSAYRLGDLPGALTTLARLKSGHPGTELLQRALYWEGRFLAQLGRWDEAIASYQATVTAEPLSYYATLARGRLRDVGAGRELARTTGVLVAELSLPADADETASDLPPEPAADELPVAGGYVATAGTALPWGERVIDWNGPEGRRAQRLIRLGLHQAAVELVARQPDLPGQNPAGAALARARLYHTLGAFDRAHRLASIVFANELRREPTGASRPLFELAYPAAHEEVVTQAAVEFNTSPWLILAVMRQESAFRPEVRSPMNARGLMQILPTTGERIADALAVEPFASEMLNDPTVAVRFGGWYLAQLVRKFNGNAILAISAYNAGPTAVSQWVSRANGAMTDEFVEEIPFRETRGYVRRVLGNLTVYSALYGAPTVEIPARLPTQVLADPSF